MNRSNHQFTFIAARAFAAVALAATIAFGAGPALAAKAPAVDRAEARITDMHAKLKITTAQEPKWTKVAEMMRDNAKTMDALTQTRFENAKTMNAIDDLKSYGEITDAHADGIKKFTPVFATLYADMSDAQKKEADTLFRRGHKKSKNK
jgi:acyl-coenzyme A synthetase/AMP-(fatty) acid ligase